MSVTAPAVDGAQRARDKLLDIGERCAADRHALFPPHAREILAGGRAPALVVFGLRGVGCPQQLDAIEHVVRLNPGMRIAALVDDADGSAIKDGFRGYPVLPVSEFFARAGEFAGCLVVDRTCTWYPGVRYKSKLKQHGLAFLRVEQFLNAPGIAVGAGYYRTHSDFMLARLDDFLALDSIWDDQHSREAYYCALAAFIGMNHEYFVFHCGDYTERYFPADIDFKFSEATVLADCGSHDGQEALFFARLTQGRFKALHAFEPDHRNFINVSDNVHRHIAANGSMPIYCHEYGVYDRNAYLGAAGYDAGVSVLDQPADGGSGIHVCRLDDMLGELTHLRLEIEGAELAALRGASGLIRRCRPTMAISAYHRPSDFLDIAEFLRGADLGYRLRLRHQSLEPGVLCVYCT